MAIEKLHLNKLLKLLYLSEKELTKALKKDIREEKSKILGDGGGGGNFYEPWWFDAKKHVLGEAELSVLTEQRIIDNYRRKNLYPRLDFGFYTLWKRGDNQDVRLLSRNPKGHFKNRRNKPYS